MSCRCVCLGVKLLLDVVALFVLRMFGYLCLAVLLFGLIVGLFSVLLVMIVY